MYKMLVKDTTTGQCGLADVPCAPEALTPMAPININGSVISLDMLAVAQALGFTDCAGNPLLTGEVLATCQDIADAIAALPADKYLQGLQAYDPATNTLTLLMNDGTTVAVPMTALLADAWADVTPAQVATKLGLLSCGGAALPAGTQIATCADLNAAIAAAIAALPGDKFLQGLQSYNAATNVMTLLMNDGTTVPVDMSGLLNDAVTTALAGIDGSETIVTAGTNTTVSGTGTTADPYVVAYADTSHTTNEDNGDRTSTITDPNNDTSCVLHCPTGVKAEPDCKTAFMEFDVDTGLPTGNIVRPLTGIVPNIYSEEVTLGTVTDPADVEQFQDFDTTGTGNSITFNAVDFPEFTNDTDCKKAYRYKAYMFGVKWGASGGGTGGARGSLFYYVTHPDGGSVVREGAWNIENDNPSDVGYNANGQVNNAGNIHVELDFCLDAGQSFTPHVELRYNYGSGSDAGSTLMWLGGLNLVFSSRITCLGDAA